MGARRDFAYGCGMSLLLRTGPLFLLAGFVAGCPSEVTIAPGDGGEGGAFSDGGAGGDTTVVTNGGSPSVGGSGGGIGEPSDVYPAPHPAAPTVANLGGPVMNSPVFVPVYFSGDDMALLSGVTDFINKVGTTQYWKATTAEYGVGAAGSLPPVVVNEVPISLDDADVQAWLAAKLNANDPAFPTPSLNTLYALYYPAGVTITTNNLGGGTSCQDFGAYHNSIQLDAAHGNIRVPYAVMPRCGSFGGFGGVDGLAIPSSHEFIEAATDPLPLDVPAYGQTDDDHLIWSFILGGEVTDLCAQSLSSYTSFPGDIEYVVARSWSNQAALDGHNPCAPTPNGETYFNAAPVLEDSIDLGGGYVTKGVVIGNGESRTIDIKLFSDGPTPPFNVYAEDITYLLGGGGALDFSFDQEAGQNGQTLHLTITVLDSGQYGLEMFQLHAYDGQQDNVWIGLVGN